MSDIGEKIHICASEQLSEVKKSKSNIKRPCDACEMASDGVLQRAKYRYMSSLLFYLLQKLPQHTMILRLSQYLYSIKDKNKKLINFISL